MPYKRQMTEEQRRAMFARMKGAGISVYDATGRNAPEAPSTWDKIKAANEGFGAGGTQGLENIGNALTFGLSDKYGLTHSYENTGWDNKISKGLATIAALSMYTATGAQLLGVGGGVGIGAGTGAAGTAGPVLSKEALEIYQNGRGAAAYLDDAIERWGSPVWDYRIDAVRDIANYGPSIMQDVQRYDAAFAGNVDKYAPSTQAFIAEAGEVIDAAMKVFQSGFYDGYGFYPIGNYLPQYKF